MVDNTILNAGTGGDTISTDDIGGGIKVQRTKTQYGPDGTGTDVDQATPLPVHAAARTDAMHNGATALTPKFVIIDAAATPNNTILAAVAAKKIRVLSLVMVSAGTVIARFESGAGGTALTGQMNLVASSGFVLPFNPVGWFETASNTLLNLELSAAISCDGCLTYVEV